MDGGGGEVLRVLCSKKSLFSPREPGLRWLIGSPLFLPRFNIVSSFRCLHHLPNDPYSPNFPKEADDIRTLLLRGFSIVGALLIVNGDSKPNAREAAEASCKLRSYLSVNDDLDDIIAAVADLNSDVIQFFKFEIKSLKNAESFSAIFYEMDPEKFVWDEGCLIRCELSLKYPMYAPGNLTSDMEDMHSDHIFSELKDPCVAFLIEGPSITSDGESSAFVLHNFDLDSSRCPPSNALFANTEKESDAKFMACSQFCSKKNIVSFLAAGKNADCIRITVLSNRSRNISRSGAPMAEYFPVKEPASCIFANFKLDVLCFASKQFPIASAISKLVVPGLIDQLMALKKAISPHIVREYLQLQPYHFLSPGMLHPITAIYELSCGENDLGQTEKRRSLHLRLGLPLDRPLLRIANALAYGRRANNLIKYGYPYLKDVHTQIPSSGVSGGVVSMVYGSYEYYHYLLNGIDDNGWGCAYRSLQTIISWFRLQHYTSIEVPSHREIQQALVEIGDKEPSFVESHEWIGAVELGFVLDKLLGVSCKIMNVRSGAELPEKSRELALHFESQGTPVMIGGGVLAYTLLGVDYNEASGECAFLILDPHYTGSDDLKKIVSGGWCGWKKAVDGKGRSFFIKDKFYNLLLPQRPNMV